MKSLTQSIALLNSMTKVPTTDTTTTTLLTQLWNDSVRTVCNIRSGKWWFLQSTTDVDTVDGHQGYAIPAGIRKIIDIYVTVGTTVYTPIPVYSPEKWNNILSMQLSESDVPQFYFVEGNKVLIEPTPATDGYAITFRGRKNVKDLTVADLTTPTVTTIANGGTAITINAGGLVSMAGKYIRITNTGVANTGDGQWYEIASATATTITLVSPYEGTAIAAGTAACTISQMTPIPEAYDMAPIYRTLALFYQINDPLSSVIYQTYWRLYDGGQEAGLSPMVGGLIGQMLENEGESIEGAYIPPSYSGGDREWYKSRQDATGF